MTSSAIKAFQSISVLWIGTMAGAGLAFATQVVLARVLGVEQFGAFSAALAMVTLVAPLAGFGVAGYWLNAFGREGWRARRWLPSSFRFLVFSTLLVLSLILLWAWFGPHDETTVWLLTILALHALGQAAIELTSAKYQLEGRHLRLATWQFLPHLGRFVLVVLFLYLVGTEHLATSHAAIVYAIVAVTMLMFGAWQLSLMARGRVELEGHSPLLPEVKPETLEIPGSLDVVSASWPFGLAGIFYIIYFQSDLILLKYLAGESAVGIYNVAFVVMTAVYLFPSVVYQKFLLPRFHRWAHHDVDKLRQAYRKGNLAMLVLGVAAMLLLWVLAPQMLPWLFGEQYLAAISLLIILAVAIPFRFVASGAGAVLTTRNYIRTKVLLMGTAAVFNVVLNLLLIPFYGAKGAAIATVITEFTVLLMYYGYSTSCLRQIIYNHESI
ncbi:flippase [Desulfurivibrio sp. C05AmB]|uniref:flippase n=1 Tax=Desulfurivibrio sp. C05AmB TaxID=3374371 RepID=UPI00376F06EE